MLLPEEKQNMLDHVIKDLIKIDHVAAVVLGGSYATGYYTDGSDLDLGIYYFDKKPFDIERIKAVAKKYSNNGNPTVTDFYEWGHWVNGGAWIKTSCGKLDFLYKNIDQIRLTIEKSQNGVWENDFEQQPPYGFSSVIYLAETKYCIPLYDPLKIIEKLKASVQEYPGKLREKIIQYSLWSAEFTIHQAINFSEKSDLFNLMGCFTRAVKNIVSAIFAINELYPMGDKRAIEILETTGRRPFDLREKIKHIFYVHDGNTNVNIKSLKALFEETVALIPGLYKPFYKIDPH